MPIYSHSRIETFENCPLRYKFRYIDKIDRYIEGVEAFLGSRCHDTLEKLYKDLLQGKENTIEDLLKYYNFIWNQKWHDDIKIVKKEYNESHYKDVGIKALKNYYYRYFPFNQSKTLSLEKAIYVDIKDNGISHKLMGYIDRLSESNDGEYEIHDYKTSATIPDQSKLDTDKQLALYQIGIEKSFSNVKKVHLIWHYLVFDKELRSYRDTKELEKLKQQILASITAIEKATKFNSFEPKESALCNWCDYPDLCPKRKHLFTIEKLDKNEYLNEDGVKLVNKYSELIKDFKQKKENFEVKKAKIEEALIAYGQNNDYETIVGSDYEAIIKTESKTSFPKSTDEHRKSLEELLVNIGIWDKVSSLSSTKLASILRNDGLTDEQIAKINEFKTSEEKTTVALKKIKRD